MLHLYTRGWARQIRGPRTVEGDDRMFWVVLIALAMTELA